MVYRLLPVKVRNIHADISLLVSSYRYWKPQNSTDFNKVWNLVRDQGVGGSNPLSPTNIFKHINCISGFSSTQV